MPIKLYDSKVSPYARKVRLLAAELEIPIEKISLDFQKGDPQKPEYLALNPNGVVPTLVDDGFVLWESNVIVRYLATKYSTGTLCPIDLQRRADAERWMDWQQTTLGPPMGILFRGLLKTPPDAIEPAIARLSR